jgi:hypothetical protein
MICIGKPLRVRAMGAAVAGSCGMPAMSGHACWGPVPLAPQRSCAVRQS